MKESCSSRFWLMGDYSFVVADTAVEVREQAGGFWGDHRGLMIGTGEFANGIERTPGCFDKNFSFTARVPDGNGRPEIAIYPAQFREHIF